MAIPVTESWAPEVLAMANSITRDIPRIRAILDHLGIRNVDYEDPADYVPSAIAQARGRGKLVAFQAALAKADLITDGSVDINGTLADRLARLHSFVARAHLPVDARVAARRLLLASDLVCRIDAGHRHGTGLLVTPTLVATAAHLVSDLVDATDPGHPAPRAGSTSRIHVTFGDMTDLLDGQAPPTRLKPIPAPLADSWLALYSPPTAEETAGETFDLHTVAGIGADGPWDLAILQLAEAQPFLPMPPCGDLPRNPFQIHVLHHPDDGMGGVLPLLWSVGRVDGHLGDPPVRLLHSANTSDGSSGAPVFDAEFRVVGLHQAGLETRPAGDDAAFNRAVPMSPWSSRLESLQLAETAPSVTTVEKLDGHGNPVTRAVIGRLGTVERIWRGHSLEATAPERLIAVVGEPGLGLRFTHHLVHAVVTRYGGAYAAIDVANCQRDDAMSFADKVAGAFAAAPAAYAPTGLTTRQREVRSHTAPALSETLRTVAGTGGAWLVLEGFDSTAARPSGAVVDLVRQLILELPDAPGVRLVLAGWQETLPSEFEPSIEFLEAPSAEDIARTFVPPGSEPPLLQALVPMVRDVLGGDEPALRGPCPYVIAEHARSRMAGYVESLIKALMEQQRDGGP
ncbi:trypsin-like peptidase domain-containing protein [Streptomyces sp. NPDC001930]|uniref:trypsin-like peptidase domain-containing protein n=1 Tax=Streptomyces sp. NPDC001930 TaxID=3364625 RepID=UPI0036C8FF86